MMSKIQNLNGTHNQLRKNLPCHIVVYDVKDTKFEWNSQLAEYVANLAKLFMMSKIQNLNGTHNDYARYTNPNYVVYDVKDTKFEWNSQRRFDF